MISTGKHAGLLRGPGEDEARTDLGDWTPIPFDRSDALPSPAVVRGEPSIALRDGDDGGAFEVVRDYVFEFTGEPAQALPVARGGRTRDIRARRYVLADNEGSV